MLKTDASYGELQLPDLVAGQPHDFTLAYAVKGYAPKNRAWLPLGAYLRTADGTIALDPLPAGVRPANVRTPEQGDDLRLIPQPTSWAPAGGHLPASAFATDSPLLAGVAALADRCNLPAFLSDTGVPVHLTEKPDLPPEAYRMEITAKGITAEYGGPAGAHYAGITLLVLRATHDGNLPCGAIDDAPRFEWRGQHLDCARHFYGLDTILKLTDLMALLKLNRFHWHFSDDEAFRIEVDCIPDLCPRTSVRGEGQLVPGVFGGGIRSGGHYSKADVQHLIDHTRALHIEVLPEVEFPAHAMAVARAFPETRDPDDRGTERSVQGYDENVLNPAIPATWDMFVPLAREIAGMFPFGMLHLGADELPENTWAGSPAVDRLKAEHGLANSDDVQGWALDRLAGILAEKGIRTAAWEEAARGSNGGIGNGALLFSWTGQQAGIDAAKAGYDIVMSPAQHVYLDMAHTSDPDDWGAAWAAFVSLSDTIDWAVIPDPAIADRVKGVEGTFWSEFTTRDAEMEPMIAPRIMGVATKAWCVNEAVDPAQFHRLSHAFCAILTTQGWNWNRACFQ